MDYMNMFGMELVQNACEVRAVFQSPLVNTALSLSPYDPLCLLLKHSLKIPGLWPPTEISVH